MRARMLLYDSSFPSNQATYLLQPLSDIDNTHAHGMSSAIQIIVSYPLDLYAKSMNLPNPLSIVHS